MAGSGNELDLPEWNTALADDKFDCSPVKQPLIQAKLKDGNKQRVTDLARTAAGPAGALLFNPQLVIPRGDCSLPSAGDAQAESRLIPAEPPRSTRLAHTPSRTGLTSKPVRLTSQLGATPAAKQPQHHAVLPVPPPSQPHPTTGAGKLKSILKRLNFSATKPRAAAATTAGARPRVAPAPAQATSSAATVDTQSTIKQLRFEAGTTPMSGAVETGPQRHVTFDATAVSPAAQSLATMLATMNLSAHKTPQTAIFGGVDGEAALGDGSSGSDDGAVGSVNSARAGHTPYDRRLSSLVRKYQVAGTPELPDAALETIVEGGAARSPSWKRLSSASVPESIRELAKKYTGSSSLAAGGTASPSPTAGTPTSELQAAAQSEAMAATPAQPSPGDAASPGLEPTPHHVVDTMLQRNALYESPPASLGMDSSAPGKLASGQQLQQQQQDGMTEKQTNMIGAVVHAVGPPSPASAVARLMAPVLLATIQDIAASKGETLPPGVSLALPVNSPAGQQTSPAGFAGFPGRSATPRLSTPASAPRSASDGVPRDAEGIPTVTPATVTVRRGSHVSGLAAVAEEEHGNDLAANLFSSFSLGSPASCADVAMAASPVEPALLDSSSAPAAASPSLLHAEDEAGTPEFSFFPANATSQHRQGAAQQGPAAALAITPELPGAQGQGQALDPSPEILGFYEAQARAGERGMEGNADMSGQAVEGRTMPRSLIKSGRPLGQTGTPLLGRAQRDAVGAPPPSVSRELAALMADLKLEDATQLQQMGTVPMLSPVAVRGARMRGLLGNLARAVTPVRRSARKRAGARHQRGLEEMLEEAGFAYVPNTAPFDADALPNGEHAEASAAEEPANCTACASTASLPQEALAVGLGVGQPGGTSKAAGRRCSTRSAAKPANNSAEAAPLVGPGQQETTLAADALLGDMRRLSLQSLRTPVQQWQQINQDAATPQASLPAAETPVAQDASPSFGETSGGRMVAYSLRPSTVEKARQSQGLSTGKKAAAPAVGRRRASSKQEPRASDSPAPQLSPTEQGIRTLLRRSARKSQGPK